MVDKRKDEGGYQHTTECSDDGQHGFLGRRKLTVRNLSLDLQADREEKEYHEDIVDEPLDGHVPREEEIYLSVRTGEMYLYGGFEEILVKGARCRQVGQKHRDDDAGQEQHALEPGCVRQFPGRIPELPDGLVPGENRYESHSANL